MKQVNSRWLLLGLIMAAGPTSLAQAAHLVTFTRGQSIVVQSFEKRGNWYYFILDGGGEMGVPLAQVTQIEDYEAPPAPAVAPGMAAPSSTPTNPVVSGPGGNPTAPANLAQPASTPPQSQAAAPPEAGTDPNVVSHGNDWRFRARMSGGPMMQQGGGVRKAPGMGQPQGPNAIMNPYNRRAPGTPPAQPSNPNQ